MKEAKQLEKKYEWLQAAQLYEKAANSTKDPIERTEVLEKLGFSYYKAAMQAPTNEEFENRMKLSIQTYKKGSELLKEKTEVKQIQAKLNHFQASIAYANSCLEQEPSRKKKLLSEWWTLEKQAKEEYEKTNNLRSLAKTFNNLIEYSTYDWLWSSSTFKETKDIYEECINLTERAITILLHLEDEYELARAYCFGSWYYSFNNYYWESEEKIARLNQKAQEYSNKALELAHEIGDAWLLSQSYIDSWMLSLRIAGNVVLAIEDGQKILKHGELTKDNWCIGWGHLLTAMATTATARQLEDPDEQRQGFENSIRMNGEAIKLFQRIHSAHELHVAFNQHVNTLSGLVEIESNQKTKVALLEQLNELIKEKKEFFRNREGLSSFFLGQLSINLLQLAKTETESDRKRALLLEAKSYSEQQISFSREMQPFRYSNRSNHYVTLAMVLRELADTEPDKTRKICWLNEAADSVRTSLELIQKRKLLYLQSVYASGRYFGTYYDNLGKILQGAYSLTKDEKQITEAIEAYKNTVFYMEKAGLPTHVAEAHWHLAQLNEQIPNLKEASEHYKLASKAYNLATENIPKLKNFYTSYSQYMMAWDQIQQAKQNHLREDYAQAMKNYDKAAAFFEKSQLWSYLSPNYFAWVRLEEGEDLSRRENQVEAIKSFQLAKQYFEKAHELIESETAKSNGEQQLSIKLLRSSSLRQRYCQARVSLEEAKILERKGSYTLSSDNYKSASQAFGEIVKELGSDVERRELQLMEVLSRAWEKMALAEGKKSPQFFLEAAELFEKATNLSTTEKTSLWALGNSSFCKGLAAGLMYQNNVDEEEHARAKQFLKSAATNYLQAGFRTASEYAKASQRLFDAYLFMNQAEVEVDQEKRAKQYQMAENLLQIAAGSFMKAQQPEKTAQVQQILESVMEEKALAVSLSQVMQAPSIASSTLSFSAPTPTSEVSVGLEQFQHANVQANLIAGLKEVKVGESFCLTVEFVNAGREPALLTRVEDFVPQDFVVVKKPEIYRLEESCLNMKGKQIAPLKLVEAKLVLQPSKKGIYQLKPTVHYLDELGQSRSLQLKAVEVRVEEVILANRISTGTRGLDSLLLGGIPKEYAVILTGPPSDERELIITNFLEAGIGESQASFYVATEAVGIEDILEKSGFDLFLCNPKPKVEVPDLPNVHKLLGKTDLTNLNIALLKAYRCVEQSSSKRVCLGIVSDVLLRYGAEATRRWVSELITDMVSKGFTILAVLDPSMHPVDQANAVINLFDGEISLYQTEDPLECKKSLRIKKLRNQDYIKNPICLT